MESIIIVRESRRRLSLTRLGSAEFQFPYRIYDENKSLSQKIITLKMEYQMDVAEMFQGSAVIRMRIPYPGRKCMSGKKKYLGTEGLKEQEKGDLPDWYFKGGNSIKAKSKRFIEKGKWRNYRSNSIHTVIRKSPRSKLEKH